MPSTYLSETCRGTGLNFDNFFGNNAFPKKDSSCKINVRRLAKLGYVFFHGNFVLNYQTANIAISPYLCFKVTGILPTSSNKRPVHREAQPQSRTNSKKHHSPFGGRCPTHTFAKYFCGGSTLHCSVKFTQTVRLFSIPYSSTPTKTSFDYDYNFVHKNI